MPKKFNLEGQRFGSLLVLEKAGRLPHKGSGPEVLWRCRCDCGNEHLARTAALRNGSVTRCRKCGFLSSGETHRTHGLSGTIKYKLWNGARHRARVANVPFELKIDDIPEIPPRCPLLGIPLQIARGCRGPAPNSPTLDRLIPSKGYVAGNVWIISEKANRIKQDATVEELQTLVQNLVGHKRGLDYAALLVGARAVENLLAEFPEAKNTVINALMDVTTPQMVWQLRVTCQQERIAQHEQDCATCILGVNAVDCQTASMLCSKLLVYQTRLRESETWTPQPK